MHLNTVSSSQFASYCVIDATDDENFGAYLESFVRTSLTSTSRRVAASYDKCAKHWDIQLDCAKATIQCSTKKGVHMYMNPDLSRRFLTYDHMLQHRYLSHPKFTNMMFANKYMHQNNKCEQVFASDFGWVHVYPMKTQGEANKALSLLIQCEGMPPSMVMDR